MSEGSKHGSVSGLPSRRTRKIPVMAPTTRTQSGCSADAENNHPFPRGPTGLPRSRLGNRLKKPVLSEYRQNQMASKPLADSGQRVLQSELSRSTPNLSRASRAACPKVASVVSAADNLQKMKSLESLARPRKLSVEKAKVQPPSRIPTKPATLGKFKLVNELLKKPKRGEMGKKPLPDKGRPQKAVENKRKSSCTDNVPGHSKQKITSKELLSPTTFPYPLSPSKNRVEECTKIVRKIMLDKKMTEMGERKRSSTEFEDSVGTFNSDEIVDLLMSDSHLKHQEATRISDEMESSKRNSSEFDDSIGSFFSDHMVLDMSKSNEFLNAAGSKQSFFADNPLGLSVSEELDNLTPGLSDLSNGMDRTPSAEDLPMECEAEPESGNSTLPGPETNNSARSTSPTEELPQESLSSRTPNAPVSIITSITSIMSLDTGYQGDGELSRPESRNTENESRLLKLPVAENGIPVKAIAFDDGKTMTDSDFFTESDADAHDDLSAAAAEIGSGKGDRKAQVIDGTLYGGAFVQAHAALRGHGEPTANASDQTTNRLVLAAHNSNEDMESSGIYSDLEKKPEEVGPKDGEPVSYLGLITEQMKTIQSLALSVAERKFRQEASAEGIVKSSSAESSSTVHEATPSAKPSPASAKAAEKKGAEQKDSPGKKGKAPNRNVTSKIKALIEAPANEAEPRTKTVKKGKWDAVMDKIAQGKEENKYTPSKFRDIKSKVFQNMGPLFNGRKSEAEVKGPPRASPGALTKARSRRSTRIRSSESSLVSPKSKLSRTSASPNSSQRSSLSDISISGTPHQKSTTRTNKKRDSISPQSNESTNSANTPTRKLNNNDESISTANRGTPCRNPDLQNGNVIRTPSSTALAAMKTPSIRKTPTPRRNDTVGPTLHRTASVPLKDSNHNGIVSKSGSAVIITNGNATQNNKVKSTHSFQSKPLKGPTRSPNPGQVKNGCLLAVAKETNKVLLKQLKHNSRAFESLAILFSYCTNDLDAFSTPHLKQKLETEKRKLAQAQSDLEELQSRLIRAREELNDRELAIAELRNEKVSLGEESEGFRQLVGELREELKVVTEQKCEAESELLRECESVRCLRRELSDRTDRFENERDGLASRLSEAKRENGVLKSANREIKEEYDKCLTENQRLVELISKRQSELARPGKENAENEDVVRTRRGDSKERSPGRAAVTPAPERLHRSLSGTPNPNCLESEVESLRQVLSLKTDEVTELRRQELSLRENADRVPKLLSTITMLEGKVEDLQTQLSSQTETVRDLFKSNEHLEEELKSANIQKTRLMHKNEELQYKLKQYAEAMKQLANQKNLSERNIKAEFSPVKTNSRKNEGNLDDSMKSQMKAVVEKSDSVSYMLEMTEDSSEIVTNIIRRAESLRSSNRENSLPKKKRSKASSVSSTDADRSKRNSSAEDDFRPDIMSTPNSSPNDYEFDGHMAGKTLSPAPSPVKYPAKKAVKLNQNDFSTDLIELANDNDCEVIEITKNFDKAEKNSEMVTSTSSSSSTTSNGSHFDIESDVFSNLEPDRNVQELEEEAEGSEFRGNGSVIRTYRREGENIRPVLPVYTDLDPSEGRSVGENVQNPYLTGSKNFVKMPKVSGGEAMIGLSSDDEDVEKIRLCNAYQE